jgi:NAD(P) transhydrogenase
MVVIGSGPAGEKAATHAAYFGKRVAMVERDPHLGGVVVNSGGVPTKTLREAALYVSGFRKRDIYGVRLQLDRSRALEVLHHRTDQVMQVMEDQVRGNLRRHGIEVVHGHARLVGSGVVTVIDAAGGTRELEAGVILIATGSHPRHPPGMPYDDPGVVDSDHVLGVLGDIERMVVIGSGVIGCEYASILTALDVRVTLVDTAPRLVPLLDEEISTLLAGSFRGAGMELRLETTVADVSRSGTQLLVTLGGGEQIPVDRVLVAVGRAGNTDGLGLDTAGVAVDERGRVVVDERMRTTAAGVYAAGDVIGPPSLASVAMEEGRRAASFAFDTPLHEGYRFTAPVGVYAVPEVGQIGISEEEAKARQVDHVVGRGRFTANARANIAGSTEGMVKLICARDGTLLGVHILGEAAAELVHIGQAVMQHGGGIDYLIHASFNVPTWSDAYKYAAFDALSQLEQVTPPWEQPGGDAISSRR